MWLHFAKTITSGKNEILAILDDSSKLKDVYEISSVPKIQPVIAYLINKGVDKNNIIDLNSKLETILDKKQVPLQASKKGVFFEDVLYTDFLTLAEKVHSYFTLINPKKEQAIDESLLGEVQKVKDGIIEVKKINDASDARMYGSDQSWCIAQYGNSYWQSYRDTKGSTFYFVFDGTRPEGDPLRKVAVDVNQHGVELTDRNNTTGTIAQFGEDWEGYFKYLQSNGVDTAQFVNNPKTPEEEEEHRLLERQNSNLKWFIELSYEYKSKYIGRGHQLTDQQFDYLYNNKALDLLSQYLNTGIPINKYQESKIGGQLKKTYDRKIDQFIEEIKRHPDWFSEGGLNYSKGNFNFIKKLYDNGLINKRQQNSVILEVDREDLMKLFDFKMVDANNLAKIAGYELSEEQKQELEPFVEDVDAKIYMFSNNTQKLQEISNYENISINNLAAIMYVYPTVDEFLVNMIKSNPEILNSKKTTPEDITLMDKEKSNTIIGIAVSESPISLSDNLVSKIFSKVSDWSDDFIRKIKPLLYFNHFIFYHIPTMSGELVQELFHDKLDTTDLKMFPGKILEWAAEHKTSSPIPFDVEIIKMLENPRLVSEYKLQANFRNLDQNTQRYLLEKEPSRLIKNHSISSLPIVFEILFQKYINNPNNPNERMLDAIITNEDQAMQFFSLIPRDPMISTRYMKPENLKDYFKARVKKYNPGIDLTSEKIVNILGETHALELIQEGYIQNGVYIMSLSPFPLFQKMVEGGLEINTVISTPENNNPDFFKNLLYAIEMKLINLQDATRMVRTNEELKNLVAMGANPHDTPRKIENSLNNNDYREILKQTGNIDWYITRDLDFQSIKELIYTYKLTEDQAQQVFDQFAYANLYEININEVADALIFMIRNYKELNVYDVNINAIFNNKDVNPEKTKELVISLFESGYQFTDQDSYPTEITFLLNKLNKEDIINYIQKQPDKKDALLEKLIGTWIGYDLDKAKFLIEIGADPRKIYDFFVRWGIAQEQLWEFLELFNSFNFPIMPLLRGLTLKRQEVELLSQKFNLNPIEIFKKYSDSLDYNEFLVEKIAFGYSDLYNVKTETLQQALNQYGDLMDALKKQRIESMIKSRTTNSFNYKKFLRQAQFVSDKGDDWYVKRIMNIVYGPNWQTLTDAYEKFSEVLDNLDSYKERYRGQLMQNLPQYQTPQQVQEPEEDFFEDTEDDDVQMPPIHENCRCYIETMPGGRKIWQFSENCCEECRVLAREFNRKQFELFGI